MGLYDFTFYDLIERNTICFKEKDAWFDADDHRTLTFSQYKDRVDLLAGGLQGAGIKKGDRIGVLGKNCLEYFLLYGAAAALGAILLPINWRLSAEEVCFNLNDCQPRVVFVGKEYQDLVQGIKEKLASVEIYYNLGQEGGEFLAFDSLTDNRPELVLENVSADDGFVIIHTAAVVGRPRGALLSHGNVLCANINFDALFDLTSQDVHLSLLPLFHISGLFMATMSFHAGVLNVNMSKFDAAEAVQLI